MTSYLIAKQLLDARTDRRWSQERAALIAGISIHTYRRLESGVRASTLDSLLRVTAALDVERLELIRPARSQLNAG